MPRTIIRKSVDPGALAAELAKASETRLARLAAAEAEYADKRNAVLTKGTERVANLRRLEDEAPQERESIEKVLSGS